MKSLLTRVAQGLREGLPHDLPLGARVYVDVVMAVGAALLLLALGSVRVDEPARFLLFLLLGCLASVLKLTVPLPRSIAQQGLTMSLSFTMNFAALLILGVHEATLIAAAGAWTQCTFNVRQKNPAYRTVFSIAAMAIALQATGGVYAWCGGSLAPAAIWSDDLMALAAAACAHFVVNSGLVAGAIALSAGQRLSRVWADSFATGWINQLFGAAIGVLLARGVGQTRAWLAPITGLLLLMTYRTYRAYHERIEAEQQAVQQVSDLHEATLEALALAIDAKDRDSRTHMRRLQACSLALARAEGLREDEAQAIKTAALLHDIGLLAVPQHILAKTGRLTMEELRKMRSHPQVGAEIIRGVPFPSPVAPIILAHHERWDGTGYPAGLKWEAIPLGARILAIADRFDTILSEHEGSGFHSVHSNGAVHANGGAPSTGSPSNGGLHPNGPTRVAVGAWLDEAASVLRTEAGHALDPRLVTRFIELLPALASDLVTARATATGEDGMVAASVTPAAGTAGMPAAAAAAAVDETDPLDNIAMAHLEVHMLYDIAQALSPCLSIGDAMAQLASRLDALVPASTYALFLCEEDRSRIACRVAIGPGASLLEPMRVPMGVGPVGWVVAQSRPLVNVTLAAVSGDDPLEIAPEAGWPARGQSERSDAESAALVGRDLEDRDSADRDNADRDGVDRDSADRDSADRDSGDRDSAGRDSVDRDSGDCDSGNRNREDRASEGRARDGAISEGRSRAEEDADAAGGALRSALICPLRGEAACLGALVVARADQGIYHDDHRRILEHVAEHVAAAIQNALRFERTHEAALTDRLTGLTNSRGLAAAFDGDLGQAMTAGEGLAVLMIDVDDLKVVNDTYGHAGGDRVLREVARGLSQSVRARDLSVRYAGDEFVLVLRSCGLPEAERRAKALQAMFDGMRIVAEAGSFVSLHISVGAAAAPADGQSLEALLVSADRRMYRDKALRKQARENTAGAAVSVHS